MSLLTGDVKIRAPPGTQNELLICTSEILRNKLVRLRLRVCVGDREGGREKEEEGGRGAAYKDAKKRARRGTKA